jgi:small-conductance mechanosensitive channel
MVSPMIWSQLLQHARAWVAEYSWRVLAAILIFAAGLVAAVAVRWLLLKILRPRLFQVRHPGRAFFTAQVAALGVLVITFALVLTALGLAGPVIGFMVTVGVALGLAADAFSGFRILSSRPFQVGDLIEIKGEGVSGRVVEISLSHIIIWTMPDKHQVVIPNRKLFDRLVVNHSPREGLELSRFQFVLDSSKEIEVLETEIRAVLKAMPGAAPGHEGMAWITLIEADSVTFHIRLPASTFEAEQKGSEFLKLAKARFDEAGIAIRSRRAVRDDAGAAAEARG